MVLKKFGKVTVILFQEVGISCGVVRYNLNTGDSWLKTLFKALAERVGRVNSSGCMFMTVGTKANIY